MPVAQGAQQYNSTSSIQILPDFKTRGTASCPTAGQKYSMKQKSIVEQQPNIPVTIKRNNPNVIGNQEKS